MKEPTILKVTVFQQIVTVKTVHVMFSSSPTSNKRRRFSIRVYIIYIYNTILLTIASKFKSDGQSSTAIDAGKVDSSWRFGSNLVDHLNRSYVHRWSSGGGIGVTYTLSWLVVFWICLDLVPCSQELQKILNIKFVLLFTLSCCLDLVIQYPVYFKH